MRTGKGPARFRLAFVALPFVFLLVGCETFESLNPFDEKKTPLQGTRRQVFPGGIPGVEYNAPPQQPSNSNIQITPGMTVIENPNPPATEPRSDAEPAAEPAARQVEARPTPAPRPAPKAAPKSISRTEADEDPWAGQR